MQVNSIQYIGTKQIIFCLFSGAFIDMLGSYSSSVAKAMMSSIVSQHELGKVLATVESLLALLPVFLVQLLPCSGRPQKY